MEGHTRKRGVGHVSRNSSSSTSKKTKKVIKHDQKVYDEKVKELKIGAEKYRLRLERESYATFLKCSKNMMNTKPSDPELSKLYPPFVLPEIWRPRPNMRTDTPNWGDGPSPEARKLMELTLEYLNDGSDDECEFAGGLHISAFVDEGVWCHLNFIAKAKVHTKYNIGPYLIFAELRRLPEQSEYEVLSCQNLGPAAALPYPKLFGCRACDIAPHRDVLTHGHTKFNVGVTPEFR